MSTDSTRTASRSAAADLTIVAFGAVIVPQIILRAVSPGSPGDVAVAAVVGLAALTVAYAGTTWIGTLVPRRQSHQLVKDYIGPGMGVVVASARFLCFALVVVLGTGVAVAGLDVFVGLDRHLRPALVCAILLLALPVLLGRGEESRFYWATAALGVAALATLLCVGLVREMVGGLDAVSASSARETALTGESIPRATWQQAEASIGALFPAALLVVLGERVLLPTKERRHTPAWIARAFSAVVVAVVLTLYFMILLRIPGRHSGVPALWMALAFLGEAGQKVFAALLIVLGCACALIAYSRLPRLLRELAYDGILPRRLASSDALKPRLSIVALTAATAAVLASALLSTQAGATIFVVSATVQFSLTCLAMCMRSVGILKESLGREERRSARTAKWVFLSFALLTVPVFGATLVAEPWWLLTAILGLAVPALIMLFFRRGMGRVARTLAVTDLSAGRRLPTRVHGVVLANVVDDPTLRTLSYARSLRLSSLTAVTVDYDPQRTRRLREDWKAAALPVGLTVLGTPQAATRGHIVDFVHSLRQAHPSDVVTVFYPRLLYAGVWEGYFLRRSMPKVVADLRHEPGVVLAEVPYLYDPSEEDE